MTMADIDPYIYAGGTAVGTALGFIGKYIFNFITATITRESSRGDRLESKLFDTQDLVYPVIESATSAIREAIAVIRQAKEG